MEWVVNGVEGAEEVVEGCGTVQLVFKRVGGNINLPLPVQYTVTGTATPGLDYTTIPPVVIIPAGQTSVTLTINNADGSAPTVVQDAGDASALYVLMPMRV